MLSSKISKNTSPKKCLTLIFKTITMKQQLFLGSIIAIEEDVDEPEMSDVRHMTVANSEIRQSVDQDAEITTGGSDTRQQVIGK